MQNLLKITKLIFFVLFCAQIAWAERAMYVNDFNNIINSTSAKTNLLTYAQSNQITYLILYDLHTVHNQHNLTSAVTNQILADFISDAKQNYGITKIAAAGEVASFFQNRIITYNATRTTANEKFDVLGMEFEFWTPVFIQPGGYYCTNYLSPNGLTCDSTGAFAFCIDQLQQMKTMTTASSHSMTVEMYVGWPNAGQLKTIANIVDKTLIHAYVMDPSSAFNYALSRLQFYDTYAGVENVSIIYSAEPNFMGPWLSANNMEIAEQTFTTAYNAASGNWKNHVNVEGFTYFTYSYMTNIVLPLEVLDFQAIKQGNSVKLDWKTAHQDKVKGFEIQRSLDGFSFSSISFEEISSASTYTFLDKNNTGAATHYYRLKILDIDGTFQFSKLVSVQYKNKPVVHLFPNPSRQELFIQTSEATHKARFRIFNSLGALILEGDSLPEQLDLSHFSAGSYSLVVGAGVYFFQKW